MTINKERDVGAVSLQYCYDGVLDRIELFMHEINGESRVAYDSQSRSAEI